MLPPAALAAASDCIALMSAAQSVAGARCIHTDFEIDSAAIAGDDAGQFCYAVVRESGLAGAAIAILGAEISDTLERGWLRGPFVAPALAASGDAFAAAADLALGALLASLSGRVRQLDAFVETSHLRALQWYATRGFESVRKHGNYIVRRADARYREVAEALPPAAAMIDAIAELASTSFPGGYLTRDDFAAPPCDDAITLAMVEGEQLLGYVHASYEPGAIEAFIDNLAVAEAVRRRGVGRQLLNAALWWAFETRGAPQVGLTVKEGNTNAERLYQSVGFELLAEGQHLRRRLAASDSLT
jgi:ribosomal protein S18 acetylase RimI-like enzyme